MKTVKIWTEFFSGLMVVLMIVAMPITIVLFIVDQHVMPLGLVAEAARQADVAPQQWKTNLTEGPNNVNRSHSNWTFAKAGKSVDSKVRVRSLINVFAVVVAVSEALLLILSKFTGDFLQIAFADTNKKTYRVYMDDVRSRYDRLNRRRKRR